MKPSRLLLPLMLAALVLGGGATGVRADAGCSATNVVFYSGDSQNLATALHNNPSACADYWISITPILSNGEPRLGPCPVIHSFGEHFHCLAELRPKQWANKLVGGDWYATGVKLHDDMLAAGFDPARDTWAVNEVGYPSDSPTNTDVYFGNDDARQHFQDFVHGLDTGSGGPPMPGLVFAADVPQVTTNLSTYEQGLARWYGDTAFWQDMQRYVRFWAQETYADARAWGVPGADIDTIASYLNDYFLHGKRLARGAVASFFANAYTPLGNAAYRWTAPPDGGIGFGMTDIPIGDMLSFISAQTYALRTSTPTAFGFAIGASKTSNGTLNAQIYDRLAHAIHDSESSAAGACTVGCLGVVPGAAFPETWRNFATPPTITRHVDGPQAADGWYTGDVTISWDVTDAQTPIWSESGCEPVVVTEDTAGVTFTCTATSSGGTATDTVTVRRDTTPPEIAPTVNGPLSSSGWYTGDVTVAWSVADSLSPVGSTDGCATTTVTADTAGTTFTCTATSDGGTASRTVTIRRDATAPSLTCTPTPATIWPPNHKLVPVDVEIVVTDATSGPAGPARWVAHESLRADKDAVYELAYSAADAAGNAATCTATVVVPHDERH